MFWDRVHVGTARYLFELDRIDVFRSVAEITPQDDANWHTTAAVCAAQPAGAGQHTELRVRSSVDQHVQGVDRQRRHVPPKSAALPSLWHRQFFRQAGRWAQQDDDHVYQRSAAPTCIASSLLVEVIDFLPRDALVHSAVLRLHVVRLSVCSSVCLWRWWIRIT